jgi:hypothetical protein
LKLSTDVLVKVVEGIPDPLARIVHQHDQELVWWLLIQRMRLEQTASGLGLLLTRLEQIKPFLNWSTDAEPNAEATQKTIELIRAALDRQESKSIAQAVRELETDVLGAYFFRVPIIHLYWQAIGLASAIVEVPVEDLTIVVLAHELAHAYSCGEDKDGTAWDIGKFAGADLHIVEGLAQFYTQLVCTALSARKPALVGVFQQLLLFQSSPYTCFREWSADHDRSREVIRYAMIDCRARGTTSYDTFLERLRNVKQSLPKWKGHATPAAAPSLV